MAFSKPDYVTNEGVKVSYWKIINYTINNPLNEADISFGGWVDKDSFDNDKDMADIPQKVVCNLEDFNAYFGQAILSSQTTNPILQMYKYAKDKSVFFLGNLILPDPIYDGLYIPLPGEVIPPALSEIETLKLQIEEIQFNNNSISDTVSGLMDFVFEVLAE